MFGEVLVPLIQMQARAEVYMTAPAAASTLFPGSSAVESELELTDDEIKQIEASTDQKVRSKKMKVFQTSSKNVVFIDQVLGKHEFITYAVGIKSDGSVAGIEILEYRESYGQQVRNEEWRKQFVGKTNSSKLKAGDDVKVLSGATLSSAHLAAGVKRVLKTYDLTHSRI